MPSLACMSGGTKGVAASSAARSKSRVARAAAPPPPALSMAHPSSAMGLGALGARDAAFLSAAMVSPCVSRHIARPLTVLGLSDASFSALKAFNASDFRPSAARDSAATRRTRRSHARILPHPSPSPLSALHALSARRAESNAAFRSPAMYDASHAALHPATTAPGLSGSGADAAAKDAAASDAAVVTTPDDDSDFFAHSSATSASVSAVRRPGGSIAAPAAEPGGCATRPLRPPATSSSHAAATTSL